MAGEATREVTRNDIRYNRVENELNRVKDGLEQKPCEDAVSRAEVLNLVRFNAFHVKSQIKAIENMPSVTPQEPRWIPIDEKRPSGFEKVLVTYRLHCDDSIHVGFGGIECNLFNGKYYWNINEQVIGWHVLAWMPLPQPYVAESENT